MEEKNVNINKNVTGDRVNVCIYTSEDVKNLLNNINSVKEYNIINMSTIISSVSSLLMNPLAVQDVGINKEDRGADKNV